MWMFNYMRSICGTYCCEYNYVTLRIEKSIQSLKYGLRKSRFLGHQHILNLSWGWSIMGLRSLTRPCLWVPCRFSLHTLIDKISKCCPIVKSLRTGETLDSPFPFTPTTNILASWMLLLILGFIQMTHFPCELSTRYVGYRLSMDGR